MKPSPVAIHTHNCCEYVVIRGVFMAKGPLAKKSSFFIVWFGTKLAALISDDHVIGGPANPINIPKPKHAKKAINTITTSRLCILYKRILTERSQRSWWYAGAMYLLNSLNKSLNCDKKFLIRSMSPPVGTKYEYSAFVGIFAIFLVFNLWCFVLVLRFINCYIALNLWFLW